METPSIYFNQWTRTHDINRAKVKVATEISKKKGSKN